MPARARVGNRISPSRWSAAWSSPWWGLASRGMGAVARQRLVYDLLKDELAGPVHALALRTLTPGEDKR